MLSKLIRFLGIGFLVIAMLAVIPAPNCEAHKNHQRHKIQVSTQILLHSFQNDKMIKFANAQDLEKYWSNQPKGWYTIYINSKSPEHVTGVLSFLRRTPHLKFWKHSGNMGGEKKRIATKRAVNFFGGKVNFIMVFKR